MPMLLENSVLVIMTDFLTENDEKIRSWVIRDIEELHRLKSVDSIVKWNCEAWLTHRIKPVVLLNRETDAEQLLRDFAEPISMLGSDPFAFLYLSALASSKDIALKRLMELAQELNFYVVAQDVNLV